MEPKGHIISIVWALYAVQAQRMASRNKVPLQPILQGQDKKHFPKLCFRLLRDHPYLTAQTLSTATGIGVGTILKATAKMRRKAAEKKRKSKIEQLYGSS